MKNRICIFFAVIINCSCAVAQTPNLWGTTNAGGTKSTGNIFKINPTNVVADEYNFGNDTDGQVPCSALFQVDKGLLYGMTRSGGAFGSGIIFSYSTSTGTEIDLHDFGRVAHDGEIGYGSFIQDTNSLLYGMTYDGGIYDTVKSSGGGIIFSFNTETNTETKLYDFGHGSDGKHPHGSLIQATNGLLYGLTQNGGVNDTGTTDYGDGTIFSYNIATGVETKLHDFGGTGDGKNPYGTLIQASNGLLYGMAPYSYTNAETGVLFSYDITGKVYTVLHTFGVDTDGALPFGSLIEGDDSLLYGMTDMGGGSSGNGGGVIFSYNISTGKETILHSFGGGSDGYEPGNSLVRAGNGLYYAITTFGGTANAGTVFSYDASNDSYTTLWSFSGGADGLWPEGDLIEVDSTTGINQLTADNGQLTVYPNPSSDFIYVSLTQQQTQPVQLSLYNMLGQQVYTTLTPSNTNPTITIPVTNLPDGVYVLRVNERNATQQKEVIVAQ